MSRSLRLQVSIGDELQDEISAGCKPGGMSIPPLKHRKTAPASRDPWDAPEVLAVLGMICGLPRVSCFGQLCGRWFDMELPMLVHPTAIICPSSRLAAGVRVGPYAVIGSGVTLDEDVSIGAGSLVGADSLQPSSWSQADAVTLGAGVNVGAHCRITGQVRIGARTEISDGCRLRGALELGMDCQLFDNVIVGNPGQFPAHHERNGRIEIGDRCVLREGVVVAQPILSPLTSVGSDSYLMARTQVDHDCRVGEAVKTGTGVTLGGSVDVGDFAYLGMNAVVHQRSVVGAYTMIGMNGVVMRHVPPYAVLVNRRFTKINRRGLVMKGWSKASLEAIEVFYRSRAGRLDDVPEESWRQPIRAFLDQIDGEEYETIAG